MIATCILEWYILILLISSLSFIITFDLFKNLNDKGYCISKIIGISLLSLISLTLTYYNPLSLSLKNISYISFALITIFTILIIIKNHKAEGLKEIYKFIDLRYRLIILTEITFLTIISFGSYVRAFFPDLLAVHKINELGYVRSIINSISLFPENLWFSGLTIGKNFFGYYILSNIISLYPQNMEVTLNIIPSTILAILVIVSGSIVYNITSRKTYGILSGFFTLFLGNYEAVNVILKEGLVNNFNWWSSCNFLANKIITEFPLWSALFGDIEPYFIALPFLATLFLLIYLAIKENLFISDNKISIKSIYLSGIIILISNFCWAINIYASIILIILFFTTFCFIIARFYRDIERLKLYLILITTFFTVSIIPSVYFLLSFHNNISIILTNKTCLNSLDLFKLLGVFIIPIIILAIIQFNKLTKLSIKEYIFISVIFLSIIEFGSALHFINSQLLSILFGMLFLSIIILSILKIRKIANTPDKKAFYIIFSMIIALLVLIVLASSNYVVLTTILILIAASLLLADKENSNSISLTFFLILAALSLLTSNFIAFDRNTIVNNTIISYLISQSMFIFTMLLSLVIHKTSSMLKDSYKEVYITILSVIILPALLFAIFGPYYMAHKFAPIEELIPNLNGNNHISIFHSGDYSAIEWIKDNIKPGQVIIEGIKDNLPYSGRISAYSGSSTILQRPDDQIFLYGDNIVPVVRERKSDLDQIYKEENKQKIIPILKKYNIKYVYIGEIEKSLYPIKSLESFSKISSIVYKRDKTTIYKLNWSSVN